MPARQRDRRSGFAIHRTAGLALVVFSVATLSAGSIKYQVVDDIHGDAIAGARLVLSGAMLDMPLVGSTDAAGLVRFADLPEGEYSFSAEKAGYLPLRRGAEPWAEPLKVKGADETRVTVTMSKFRAISGSVMPQTGALPRGVSVYAIRIRRGPPEYRLEEEQLAQTDDGGNFRITHLSPGRYAVCASARTTSAVALPVCYPDATSPASGVPVDVRFTEEVSHIALVTRSVGTGDSRLEGMISSLPGAPDRAEVLLCLIAPGAPPIAVATTSGQIGRPFRFSGVPAGSYALVAVPKDSRLKELRGMERVQVPTEAASSLTIALTPSEAISGRAELQKMALVSPDNAEGRSAMLPAAGVTVYAESDVLSLSGLPERVTGATGDFKLEGAVKGLTYLCSVKSPKGTYIYSIEQRNTTLAGAPFPIVAGAGAVRITLRDDGGSIEGTALRDNAPMYRAFVVLAPRDRDKQHLFRTATSAVAGSFRLTDIAPGSYDLFGLDRNEEDMYYEPGYLGRFLDRAAKVVVTPGGVSHLDLQVIDPSVGHAGK